MTITHLLPFLLFLIAVTGCQEAPTHNHGAPSSIAYFTGTAMTIDYHITVGASLSAEQQLSIKKILEATFANIDNVYNKWNPASELSQLNKSKAHITIPLSHELEQFLFRTQQIVELSHGLFDPTIEPLQKLWKKHLQNGHTPSEEEIAKILPAIGWSKIHFGNGQFVKDHDLTSLDLGGIAKGLAVDMLVERLNAAGYPDVYVEWGGEIRASGKHPDNRPWNIFISRLGDADPDKAIDHVSLKDQAIATSGDYLQYWTVAALSEVGNTGAIHYFHIIDPRTHRPLTSTPSSVASASVVAPTCAFADGVATVAMMFPTVAEAQKWADEMKQQYSGLEFWLVSRETAEK